jgi:dephospho-CoA kinase
MLAAKGALVIRADDVGHAVLERGGGAHAAVAARWPACLVDGRIDRSRLAAIVFSDADELAALEAITHPAIGRLILFEIEHAGTRPVVVEVPVHASFIDPRWIRVLVDVPEAVRLERAVGRGADAADVANRMAAQPTRQQRLAWADHVIENAGTLEELAREVDELWATFITSNDDRHTD